MAGLGCAQGGTPEPMILTSFGGPEAPGGTGGTDAEGSDGAETGSPVGSGDQGSDSNGATSTTDGGLDTTAAADDDADDDATTDMPPPVCPPDPGDDACFMCARQWCCPQVQTCEADPVCSCSIDCIAEGGDPGMCNDDCGGANEATVALLGCTYVQCPKCEKL